MSFLSAPTRPSVYCALWALVASVVLIAGCGGSGAERTDAGYAMGEPIDDSTLAAIVEAGDFSDTLSYANLEQQMNQLTRGRLPMMPDSVQQQVQRVSVVRFLTTAAQIAEAQGRGLEADSGAVNQQLQQLQARMGSDSLFQARLAQSGMTMAELRQNIREQLVVRELQQTLADEVEDPTADEVNTYRQDQAREVRVQQILFEVPPQASPAQRDSVQMRARTVLDSIQNGSVDFSSAAQRYSQGGGNEQGSLGYQTRQQMAGPFGRQGQPPEQIAFVQRAFALQDSGDVADEPVRTRYGYHLIRKTGARTGQLADSSQAAQQLAQQRRQESVTEAVEGMRENVTLRVNPSRVTADMSQALEQGQEGAGDS